MTGRLAVFAATALTSGVASACPACAGREEGSGTFFMLAMMITAPFVVVAFVVPAIRLLQASERVARPPVAEGAE